jgi:hypothetical protein
VAPTVEALDPITPDPVVAANTPVDFDATLSDPAGANAKFRGVGTINSVGAYDFMITARDGNLLGGGNIVMHRN